MKKFLVFCFIVIFIFTIIYFLKDQIIKTIVSTAATKVVGAPVKIDEFAFSILDQNISIKGLKVKNPQGYPDEVFLDVPEISVEYNISDLLRKKLYFPLIVFNLKELIVIKDKDGKLNVDSLKVAQQQEKGDTEKEDPNKSSEAMPLKIDVLKLNVDKVVFKDFTVDNPPLTEVYNTGVKNKTYKNIKSAKQLAVLILTSSMRNTTIKGAAIYGVATLLGTAVLPVGVASVFVGKDSAQSELKIDYDTAFDAALSILKDRGKVSKDNKESGVIKGTSSGCKIAIKVERSENNAVKITVSARKMLLPKPKIAGGILHSIEETLEKK